METYRIRYLGGRNPARAIQLVREFMGVGLHAAKQLVETRAVILDNVSAAEARRVADRFTRIGAEVEVERTWQHLYAYAPQHNDRGDQPITRLRVGELEIAVDRGQLGALALGEPQPIVDGQARAWIEHWARAGLQVTDSEIAVLEAVSARDLQLEAELRERPDDVDAHLIYGDWLQAQGDVRGQLVLLQHAQTQTHDRAAVAELRTREQQLLRRHASHLFGPLRPFADVITIRWSLGFIDAAFVGAVGRRGAVAGLLKLLDELLRLPVAARLQSLGLTNALLQQSQLESLLCSSEVVACLRELELGDHLRNHLGNPGAIESELPLPSFGRLWTHLRKLRKLTLHGDHPPLRALHSRTLEHLELHMLALPHDMPEPFVDGRLPQLRTLTLDLPSAEQVSPAAFANLLALPEFDGVTELILQLPNDPIPHALAGVLASIPRLAGLELLDLSRCIADARAMELIVDARDRSRLPDGLRLPRAC